MNDRKSIPQSYEERREVDVEFVTDSLLQLMLYVNTYHATADDLAWQMAHIVDAAFAVIDTFTTAGFGELTHKFEVARVMLSARSDEARKNPKR